MPPFERPVAKMRLRSIGWVRSNVSSSARTNAASSMFAAFA
jgi:hypothetical protein